VLFLKTLEQLKEWYVSAVKSALVLNFGCLEREAEEAVSAYRLREKLDEDPMGQLANNIEGVAEDIAGKEFVGRPSGMIYKGYYANIRFDSELKHLYGKIEGIREFIAFESETVEEIEEKFHKAVDDYLAFCKDRGKKPEQGIELLPKTRIGFLGGLKGKDLPRPGSGNLKSKSSAASHSNPDGEKFLSSMSVIAAGEDDETSPRQTFNHSRTEQAGQDMSDEEFLRFMGINPEDRTGAGDMSDEEFLHSMGIDPEDVIL
jgi:hypothetical protein